MSKLCFDEDEFKKVVKQSKSLTDVCRYFGKPKNGFYTKTISKWIEKFKCDISHFENSVKIVCQRCQTEFTVQKHDEHVRKFCSRSCANGGSIRGNAKPKPDHLLTGEKKYIKICFRHHKKECVICGETKIVTVHHFDENHDNNLPENLVPVCPTHHGYLHSRYKSEVMLKIKEYVENFSRGAGVIG